jgi:3'(2'), 5'-bisphosphate nucleotidase
MTNLLTPIAPLIASVITPVITIARQAGEKILQVYQQDFTVIDKADHTPLTQADLQAHEHIVACLRALTPELPVISEESSPDEIAQRMSWTRYWLVDPLDGTKEFIKKNGEFTVNIALIDNGVAVFGVVYAPVPNTTWWGAQQQGVLKQPGAFKIQGDQPAQAIHVSAPPASGQPWRVVGSRSHGSPAQEAFMQQLPNAQLVPVGSSIKLCLVAEGRADLYPKLGPTGEWDTAAGQAVVEAAGGQVVAWPSLQTLRYNQRPDTLINPDFMVCAQPDEYWAGPR